MASATLRAYSMEVETMTEEESGPCSASFRTSQAATSGSTVPSAMIRASLGPAGRSTLTTSLTSLLAAYVQGPPGPATASTRLTVRVP